MSSRTVFTPASLQILASTVEFAGGNYLLSKIVLDHCDSKGSVSVTKAVLRSLNAAPVNDLNDDGYNALHLAVLAENVTMVKMLLSCVQNIDINKRSEEEGRTAIHIAAESGCLPIVEELVAKEADLSMVDDYDKSVFDLAARRRRSGNLSTLIFLFTKRDGIAVDLYNDTPFSAILCDNMDILEWLLHNEAFTKNMLDPLICMAASQNNINAIKMLVAKGANFNAFDELLKTPLNYALRNNNYEVIQFLLNKNAEFNALDKNGRSLIHSVALTGDLEVLKYVVNKIEDVNIKDEYGSTLLYEAARSNNFLKVAFLVHQKCDVNARDRFGNCPIHNAAISGNLEILKYLINEKTDPYATNDEGKTVYHFAAEMGHLHVIIFLQKMGIVLKDVSSDHPMLCCAARSRNLATIQFFLHQSNNVNVLDKRGRTPLFYAAQEIAADVRIVKALLEKGASVHMASANDNPIFAAVQNGSVEITRLLLEKGAPVNARNKEGDTPLLYCLQTYSRTDMVRLLIKWNANIESKCDEGYTAFHLACNADVESNADVLNCLIECGANMRTTSKWSAETPLHAAATRNNLIAQRLLVAHGADKNAADKDGYTPLHYAAREGHATFVKRLLRNGAYVDTRGLDGQTPLHLAAIKKEWEVAAALVEAGANEYAEDDYGKTPVDYRNEALAKEGDELDVPM